MKRTAIAAALVLAATSIQAQDKPVNLRFSYWIPPKHQLVPSTQNSDQSIRPSASSRACSRERILPNVPSRRHRTNPRARCGNTSS